MRFLSLIAFLALVGAAAVTGAQFEPGGWYEALAKPSWTPPNWLFPIAWTVLYVMIAVAGWLVWQREGFGLALAIWGLGLALNAFWSYLMFGQHDIGLALFDIIALLFSILVFIGVAWSSDRAAAYLFVPYAAWVSYACALNASIFAMNG